MVSHHAGTKVNVESIQRSAARCGKKKERNKGKRNNENQVEPCSGSSSLVVPPPVKAHADSHAAALLVSRSFSKMKIVALEFLEQCAS